MPEDTKYSPEQVAAIDKVMKAGARWRRNYIGECTRIEFIESEQALYVALVGWSGVKGGE